MEREGRRKRREEMDEETKDPLMTILNKKTKNNN